MVFNSKENGNAIFHIYRWPDGKYELINVPLLWEDRDFLKHLLQVDTLSMDDLESPEGRLYMVLHDGSSSKPYPSVMIWRYECQGEDRRIVDVEEKDLRAVVFVREYYMDRGARPSNGGNERGQLGDMAPSREAFVSERYKRAWPLEPPLFQGPCFIPVCSLHYCYQGAVP